MCGTNLKFKQLVILITSEPLLHPSMPPTSGHYCNSQGSQQGKSGNDFLPSSSLHRVPFSTMKFSQQGKSSLVSTILISPRPMSNVSLLIGSFWFALSLKNMTPLQWLWALCSPSDKTPDPAQPFIAEPECLPRNPCSIPSPGTVASLH